MNKPTRRRMEHGERFQLSSWDLFRPPLRTLSYELKGVYVELLALMWLDPQCRLPDDDQVLAGMLHVDIGKWKRDWRPRLLENASIRLFEKTSDGHWFSKVLMEQFENEGKKSRLAQRSAYARWMKSSSRLAKRRD
jgi:hypothetical protein